MVYRNQIESAGRILPINNFVVISLLSKMNIENSRCWLWLADVDIHVQL